MKENQEESTPLSSCCGAAPVSNGDSDSMDIGICPECGDHCEWEEADSTK